MCDFKQKLKDMQQYEDEMTRQLTIVDVVCDVQKLDDDQKTLVESGIEDGAEVHELMGETDLFTAFVPESMGRAIGQWLLLVTVSAITARLNRDVCIGSHSLKHVSLSLPFRRHSALFPRCRCSSAAWNQWNVRTVFHMVKGQYRCLL